MKTRDRIRLFRLQRQAEGYLELGLAQQALGALDRLGDLVKTDAQALYLRGEALRTLHRYADAVEPLELAARLDPNSVAVWLALAWCHKRTARIDLAIQDMKQALAVAPSEALLHYNLACYLSLAGQKSGALSHLSRALALDAHYRQLIDQEPDFDPLRTDPDFQALTKAPV